MAETLQAIQPTGDRHVQNGAAGIEARPAERSGRATPRDVLRALVDDKVVLVALAFIVLVLGSAIFAGVVAPHDPYQQSIRMRPLC